LIDGKHIWWNEILEHWAWPDRHTVNRWPVRSCLAYPRLSL